MSKKVERQIQESYKSAGLYGCNSTGRISRVKGGERGLRIVTAGKVSM